MNTADELFIAVKAELRLACIEDVAIDSDVHPATLRRWRNNEVRSPRLHTVIAVAEALGMKVTVEAPNRMRVAA